MGGYGANEGCWGVSVLMFCPRLFVHHTFMECTSYTAALKSRVLLLFVVSNLEIYLHTRDLAVVGIGKLQVTKGHSGVTFAGPPPQPRCPRARSRRPCSAYKYVY